MRKLSTGWLVEFGESRCSSFLHSRRENHWDPW